MVFALFISGYATDRVLGRQMHNNCMLQIQTLINQKAKAPGAKNPWWKVW
jgi:hypothetical protein